MAGSRENLANKEATPCVVFDVKDARHARAIPRTCLFRS
jgi:hypothetical protein